MLRNIFKWVALGAFAALGTTAAGIVTFDTIGGLNGDPFTTVTENGVTVTSIAGSWQKGFSVGNPAPSIFSFSGLATVNVTTGGLFTFVSFDLGTGGTSDPSYAYHGFLNNVDILDGAGTPSGNSFLTIGSSNTGLSLDLLQITMTPTSTSENLDNIVVGAATAPEPGALSLMALGLVAMLCLRHRPPASLSSQTSRRRIHFDNSGEA